MSDLSERSRTTSRDALVNGVLERQNFLEKVLPFVCAAVFRHGTILTRTIHSAHTTQTAELKGFQGFDFWHHGVYTMYGGERAKVWCGETLVLDVEWWQITECRVQEFNPSPVWQQLLEHLADDETTARKAAEAEQRAAEEAAKAQAEEKKRRAKIISQLDKHVEWLKLA